MELRAKIAIIPTNRRPGVHKSTRPPGGEQGRVEFPTSSGGLVDFGLKCFVLPRHLGASGYGDEVPV